MTTERERQEQAWTDGLNSTTGAMVWETVLAILGDDEVSDTEVALAPNQAPDTRTYNNGRANKTREMLKWLRALKERGRSLK